MDIILPVIGLACIGVFIADTMKTVLHYEGSGPLTLRIYRAVWWAVDRLAAVAPASAREVIRTWAGPLMLVTGIVTWVALAVVGFALIYLPALGDGFAATPAREASFITAIYVSAASLSTVGYGDIVAVEPVYELIVVVQSLAGFATLTLVLSYVFSLYEVLGAQSLLGARIDDETDGSADPLDLAGAILARDAPPTAMSSFYQQVVEFGEGLERFPIVYYFRRGVTHRSPAYLLHMLPEATAAIRWGVPAQHPLAANPSARALVNALRRLALGIEDRFLAGGATARVDAAAQASSGRSFETTARDVVVRTDAEGADVDGDDRRDAWREYVDHARRVAKAVMDDLSYPDDELRATDPTRERR